jgi:alkylresorcinol/alkylpyrone synthase
MATAPVSLLGLATVVPDHVLEQSAVANLARRVYVASFVRSPKLADASTNAGIERRYSVRPLEWFDATHDFSERTQAYLDGTGMLFVRAARKALATARVAARDVDTIVTVSSTGVATPSRAHRLPHPRRKRSTRLNLSRNGGKHDLAGADPCQ